MLTEQQIILGAFGYLTPSKFNQLGKIVFPFFGLSEDNIQNNKKKKYNVGKTYKTERKSIKSLIFVFKTWYFLLPLVINFMIISVI